MTDPGTGHQEDVSLFALVSALLEKRWRLVAWALAGALIAVVPPSVLPRTWTARATFVPGGDQSDAGLRNLAGQFGVMVPGMTGMSTESPEFYRDLLLSITVLGTIADDSIAVPEEDGRRVAVRDLLRVRAEDPAVARELTIERLRKAIRTGIRTKTGVITLAVRTRWASVSWTIADRLLEELGRFDREIRQSRGAHERQFVERRLEAQSEALQGAEADLEAFLESNRQFQNSPELRFRHDRLQREVTRQESMVMNLSQAYEEARIREVRDVPVLTVIEAPRIPAEPDPRRRVLRAILGLLGGAVFGAIAILLGDTFARRRAEGDADAQRLASSMAEIRVPWKTGAGRPDR